MTTLCRVCLIGNRRMECITNNDLRVIYEKLACIEDNTDHSGALTMCYICYRQLQRCLEYSASVHRSAEILKNLFDKGFEATEESLVMLNLEPTQSLSIISVTSISTDNWDITEEPINEEQDLKQEMIEPNEIIKVEETNVLNDSSTDTMEIDNGEISKKERIIMSDVESKREHIIDVKPVLLECIYSQEKHFNFQKNQPYFSNRSDSLEKHIKTQTEEVFACSECKKTFSKLSYLQTHKRTHNNNNKLFLCKICAKSFTEKGSLVTHAKVHMGERFTCDLCMKSFTRRSTIVQHMRRHNAPAHVCPTCNKAFAQIQSLKTHVGIHSKKFSCDKCQRKFKEKHQIDLHNNIVIHKQICSICSKGFHTRRSMINHMKTHTSGKTHCCERCHKSFSLPVYLKRHMATHSNGVFACTHCNKTFTLKTYLTTHVKKNHTHNKPKIKLRNHICERCACSFTNSHDLRHHLRAHDHIRSHACAHCAKAFLKKSHLNEHLRVHTGERPYACHLCSKTFTQNSTLKFHMKTHSGERPFGCKVCKKMFSNKYNLQKHVRIHTG